MQRHIGTEVHTYLPVIDNRDVVETSSQHCSQNSVAINLFCKVLYTSSDSRNSPNIMSAVRNKTGIL